MQRQHLRNVQAASAKTIVRLYRYIALYYLLKELHHSHISGVKFRLFRARRKTSINLRIIQISGIKQEPINRLFFEK
jgi:hypothetical protein